MKNNIHAQTCLDVLCFQRLNSPDFAQKKNLKSRIIRWMKGGAK